ncbi:nucleotidyltransferase domain-containing protein [Butyricimonas muris]|uniref:nucleotidyltransferase domain-containing protein n=1 Tax=Butyricimonas muris TaxID=3378067 RepID=UPI0039670DF2
MREEEINAIILYGSWARGEQDRESDIDIVVFTDKTIKRIEDGVLEHYILPFRVKDCNISIYDTLMLNQMLEYGSLFLWHIKLEGICLHGRSYLDSCFTRLLDFTHHKEEIEYHQRLLDSLLEAQRITGIIEDFDFSLLFTIVRNTCMILVHKKGQMIFSKYKCFESASQLYPGLPLLETEYCFLGRYKNAYERYSYNVNFSVSREGLMKKVGELLEFALKNVC